MIGQGIIDTEAADAIHSVIEHVDVENALVEALWSAGYQIVKVAQLAASCASVESQ